MNTSFNVAAPMAQSLVQALDTLRRANGMDGVFIFSVLVSAGTALADPRGLWLAQDGARVRVGP